MKSWKYHVEFLTLSDLTDKQTLNDYGAIGWELISLEKVAAKQMKWLAVFKKAEE